MKFKMLMLGCLFFGLAINNALCQGNKLKIKPDYNLIAHRGGVVDSVSAENSLLALKKAVSSGYSMVEVDMRLTRDGVLITQHDRNFKNDFEVDSTVSSMTWASISKLKGKRGNKVQKFEDVLQYCKGKLQVMIDNKISGNDTLLFSKVIKLLKKHDLYDGALMIGTDESTEFFTGKIKLSCTRKQLEDNMLKPGYRPENYYLFSSNISRDDAEWARKNKILAVGVINSWDIKSSEPLLAAGVQAEKLKSAGITYFQIDSIFDIFFK